MNRKDRDRGVEMRLIEHKVASAQHRPVTSTYWVSTIWQSLAISSSSFCWCQWTSDFSTWLILSHAPLQHLNVCRKVEQLLSRERNALTMDPACALCTDGIPSCWCRGLDCRRRTENGCNVVAWWSAFTSILHSQAETSAREASYCEPVRLVRCFYGPVSANTTNTFKTRLDKFWHNQREQQHFRALCKEPEVVANFRMMNLSKE